MRKTPGGGLMLPALIALIGLLAAFVAPTAHAAATYDITDVGDAEFVSIKGSDGKELSKGTTDPDGIMVTTTIRLQIGNVENLKEGDTVRVPVSADAGAHFGPNLFSTEVLPSALLDGQGNAVFTVSNAYGDSTIMTLTRTGVKVVGSYSSDLTVTSQLWRWSAGSESSTWKIGKSSTYTFASRPLLNSPCTTNSDGRLGADVHGNSISVSTWFLNCGTMSAIANGQDTSGFEKGSQIGWAHIIPEFGQIKSIDLSVYEMFVLNAMDAKTPGSIDNRESRYYLLKSNVDISTYGKTVANLPVGSIAVMKQADGSWNLAYNSGSRFPGLDNSVNMPDSSDSTTLELQRNTGNTWQGTHVNSFVRFRDENIPNRISVETQGTEYAYSRTKTLTTKPIEPPVGQGQSAIRYDPNTGDGDAFKKVGDPGTAATTAEAGVFLRQGHTFVGWNTAKDGSGTSYAAGAAIAYPAEGDTLTLYAQWTPIAYRVRFDGNKSTSGTMADLTATYDARASLPANRYAKAGYAFAGWNTKPDGSGTAYKDRADIVNLSSTQDDVVVLYAQWRGLVTVLPDTGGHATHAPLIVGGIVTAAALVIAVMARRRANRHAV